MKIIFRHSSGRGEYEVSGEASGYTSADVTDKNIIVHLASDWEIRTGLVNRLKNGKRRVRSEPPSEYMGIQRQMCTALLLNPTVRSQSQVDSGGHLFQYLEADSIEIIGDNVILYASRIIISNRTAEAAISVPRRVAELKQLWEHVDELPRVLADLLHKHKDEVTYGGPIYPETEKLCKSIPTLLVGDEEAGELIEGAGDLLPGLQSFTNIPVTRPLFDVEQIPVQEIDLKRRTIDAWRKWQLTNSRGPSGRKFSREVRAAYNSTCLICGVRLPSAGAGIASGVDAAHILPWRSYEADDVYNGICLCKNHHWAFDAGLLAIKSSEFSDELMVYVPEKAKSELLAKGEGEMLIWLESYAGVIPLARLPQDPLHRPRREFFQILAQQMERD